MGVYFLLYINVTFPSLSIFFTETNKELSATVSLRARIHDPIITVKKLLSSLPYYNRKYNDASSPSLRTFLIPFSESATISRLVRANEIFREHLRARAVYLEDATKDERDELNSSMPGNASRCTDMCGKT